MCSPIISQIVVYPVKSMGGCSLEEAELVPTGFRHDRSWMIADEWGAFITQRQHPSMALIGARVVDDYLELTIPGATPIQIPSTESGDRVKVKVWNFDCEAIDEGNDAAELLSGYLNRRCRLVRMPSDFHRDVNPSYRYNQDVSLSFSDSMPVHLISQASLDDLNSRLDVPVEIDRFRPNLVVSGGSAFQEDRWKVIRIGDVRFRVANDSIRCQIPAIDQSTGVKGIEPLETLGTYRVGPIGIRFGRHLVHEARGLIHRGDSVEILE